MLQREELLLSLCCFFLKKKISANLRDRGGCGSSSPFFIGPPKRIVCSGPLRPYFSLQGFSPAEGFLLVFIRREPTPQAGSGTPIVPFHHLRLVSLFGPFCIIFSIREGGAAAWPFTQSPRILGRSSPGCLSASNSGSSHSAKEALRTSAEGGKLENASGTFSSVFIPRFTHSSR